MPCARSPLRARPFRRRRSTACEDIKVKGGAGPLAARVYRNGKGKAPTVVFFHGGGWVAGDLETHDRQARNLAIETGAVVVSVDYRRPPETRFPGAFEDAFAAVRDVVRAHRRVRRRCQSPRRCRRQRRRQSGGDERRSPAATPASELAAQLLVYPVIDAFGNYADASENARFPSRTENAEGYFLSRAVMEWFCGHYLADKSQGADWRVSPLRAKDHAGLAPAIVCTAWFDPLRDEGAAYAAALDGADVPCQALCRRRPDPRLSSAWATPPRSRAPRRSGHGPISRPC